MRIHEALANVQRIYIEAAPLIYYVEENAKYVERMDAIIGLLASRQIEGVSSVITLTEVLNQPIKLGRHDLVQAYRDILLQSDHFGLMPVSAEIAEAGANLRARYNLRTPDALHVATALEE